MTRFSSERVARAEMHLLGTARENGRKMERGEGGVVNRKSKFTNSRRISPFIARARRLCIRQHPAASACRIGLTRVEGEGGGGGVSTRVTAGYLTTAARDLISDSWGRNHANEWRLINNPSRGSRLVREGGREMFV